VTPSFFLLLKVQQEEKGMAESEPTRRFRSKQERRRIVEETLKPGVSVSQIARAHDINANQVFAWRKLYRAGRLEMPQSSSALLPVKITEAVEELPSRSHRGSKPTKTGIIDIELRHARIRVEGAADPDCVRAAVEGLLR
jgi:transposase